MISDISKVRENDYVSLSDLEYISFEFKGNDIKFRKESVN